MSDPDVPQSEKPTDVDDVVGSANAGLDAAAAAGADVAGRNGSSDASASGERSVSSENDASFESDASFDADRASDRAAERAAARAQADADLAAFEAAEREHPGTFSPSSSPSSAADATATSVVATPYSRDAAERSPFSRDSDERSPFARDAEERSVADTAYVPSYGADDTRVLPSEPVEATSAPLVPQPIFVQAPEAPRDRGNRGTAGAIGLLATLAFAVLYLATTLGLGALAGDVTAANVGTAAVAPLTTWGFWTPVVVFFLGFWFLGAIINRGRWGLWVVFGILVGVIAYGGHILGQIFEARFWTLSPSTGMELVGEQLLAPLAIAAFVFARELTIWFGAWVARSGARKTELNAEAQREYERTLEAGPTLAR